LAARQLPKRCALNARLSNHESSSAATKCLAGERSLAFCAQFSGVILKVPERTQVTLKRFFGLNDRLPGCLEIGDERLLVGDDLARDGNALRDEDKLWPFPRHSRPDKIPAKWPPGFLL
jgi:hypothetical protein